MQCVSNPHWAHLPGLSLPQWHAPSLTQHAQSLLEESQGHGQPESDCVHKSIKPKEQIENIWFITKQ